MAMSLSAWPTTTATAPVRAIRVPAVLAPTSIHTGQSLGLAEAAPIRHTTAHSETRPGQVPGNVPGNVPLGAVDGATSTVAHHVAPGRGAHGPGPVVALTFDDGPSAYTPAILATLVSSGVKATFFEVGNQVVRYPNVVRSLAAAGMSVQNHTWDHALLTGRSETQTRTEITRTDDAILALTGVRPECVRPPYGAFTPTTLAVAGQTRHRLVNWSVDTTDWSRPGVAAIRGLALGGAANNAVILMHDGGGNRSQSVAALPSIIAGLRARGYSFVTICQ